MEYKGYIAKIEFDDSADVFHGVVVNIPDVVTFYGATVVELKKEFKNSMEDYFAFCKELKKKPHKPYSGTLYIRAEPEEHRQIAEASAKSHMSINQWARQTLVHAAQQSL